MTRLRARRRGDGPRASSRTQGSHAVTSEAARSRDPRTLSRQPSRWFAAPTFDDGRDAYCRPQAPALVGVAIVACFALALTLWGTLAPVSGAAIASGNLQVESKRQSVQHPYGGVVKALLVHEGDSVKKGQVLIKLFDTDPRSKLDALRAEYIALKSQEGRLIAERDGASEPTFSHALTSEGDDFNVTQALANERAIMAARKVQFETQVKVLQKKIAQLEDQITGAEAQKKGVERQHELLEEETNGARQLLAQGYAAKTRVLALERDLAKLESDRAARQSDIARMQQEIAATDLEIAKAAGARVSEITDQLRTTQSHLAELAPKLEAARDVVARADITAPATGAVVGLTVFTEGGVIQAGARLLDIVPSGNPLMVDARLPLNDINDVTPGMRADIRLTSLKQSERPILGGTVETVSADRVVDDKSGDSYYALQVKLNPQDVSKSHIDLQPGMPAEVIVATKPRTLIGYLIGPLTDQLTRAFRER